MAGSLGKGNLGDEALLEAFLFAHRQRYESITVLTEGSGGGGERASDLRRLEPPVLAAGRRFWRGTVDRRRKRHAIATHGGAGPVDYVWLGGLLGHSEHHLRARSLELEWATGLRPRLVYYFGDADDRFPEAPQANQVITRMNRLPSWIGVRSPEAAEALRRAGLEGAVHVGVDPALYHRATQWGIPFVPRTAPTPAVAIVPCMAVTEPAIWLDAAQAAVALDLPIRWVSLSDADDLELCRELARTVESGAPHHPQSIHGGANAESGIRGASVCVAGRYHGMIFGVSHGAATIPVPYGPKMTRLAHLLGLEDWIPHDDAPLDALVREAVAGKWRIDYPALESALTRHKTALETFSP